MFTGAFGEFFTDRRTPEQIRRDRRNDFLLRIVLATFAMFALLDGPLFLILWLLK